VVTDRISAFDVVLGTIPFKGQVLNQIAAYWFESTKQIASNHVLSVPDPTVMVAAECQLLPVEFVMRAYLTGVTTTSIWYHYEKGGRLFCGHKLPDGMRKNQKLDKPILTPSTKAAKGGHDQSVSRAEILASRRAVRRRTSTARPRCVRAFLPLARVWRPSAVSSWSTPSTRSAGGLTAACASSTRSTPPTVRATGMPTTTRCASTGARSRAGWTRSTCVACWPIRATGVTGRRPRSPTRFVARRPAATSRSTS
jgi:hypothetical protein